MPQYEGCVTHLGTDGSATVLIRPGNSGIVGAPKVNVCHAAADSSSVPIDAENKVDAKVGDLVLIQRETAGLLRNAATLVGIPAAGFIAGMALAGFAELGTTGRWILAGLGLLAGLAGGRAGYKAWAGNAGAIITRVMEAGEGACLPENGEKQESLSAQCRMCQQGGVNLPSH